VSEALGVAIVGCGDISRHYAEDLAQYPELRLLGMADLRPERAVEAAARHGVAAYAGLPDVLADPRVDIVVNLTVATAHVEVSAAALRAGKHVFSEKPLALDPVEARRLVALARECDKRLGAAPIVPLGELAAGARACLAERRLGEVRLAYADVNWGRVEAWHPRPQPFYSVGPVFDVAVYPLSLLVSLFGAASRVSAFGRRLWPARRTLAGEGFEIGQPDFVVALVEFAEGPLLRLTANWYVSSRDRQRGVSFHGDAGSLWMSNWFQFAGTLEFAAFEADPDPLPLPATPVKPMRWAYGVADMARSVLEGRAHAASAERAAHVVEIAAAIHASLEAGRPLELPAVAAEGLLHPPPSGQPPVGK